MWCCFRSRSQVEVDRGEDRHPEGPADLAPSVRAALTDQQHSGLMATLQILGGQGVRPGPRPRETGKVSPDHQQCEIRAGDEMVRPTVQAQPTGVNDHVGSGRLELTKRDQQRLPQLGDPRSLLVRARTDQRRSLGALDRQQQARQRVSQQVRTLRKHQLDQTGMVELGSEEPRQNPRAPTRIALHQNHRTRPTHRKTERRARHPRRTRGRHHHRQHGSALPRIEHQSDPARPGHRRHLRSPRSRHHQVDHHRLTIRSRAGHTLHQRVDRNL